MKRFLILTSAALALGMTNLSAMAGSNRTSVSVNGTDGGTCAPAAPCRTIAYALTQTNPSGEMIVQSSGGYGPFTVSFAVTINAPPGIIAFVSAPSGGPGITVSAGPTDLVLLTGFYVDGLGAATNGIDVTSVGSLSVGSSTFTNFPGIGINFAPVVPSGNVTHLVVNNSAFYQNQGGAISVAPSGGPNGGGNTAQVAINNASVSSSGITFDASASSGRVQGLIRDSVIRFIGGNAITATSPGASASVTLQVAGSALFGVNNGLVTNGQTAFIDLYENSLSNISNLVPASNTGTVKSYGNNGADFITNVGAVTSKSQL
jgi:hypothetical protein